MDHKMRNRILSFFLALVMLVTNVPFPVNSVESGETAETATPATTTDFDQYVGYTATFADYYEAFVLAADASAVTGYENVTWTGSVQYSLSDYIGDDSGLSDEEYYALVDAFYAMEMIVTDYFVSGEDHGALWFKVEAAEGETLPEILQTNPWIFAYYSGLEGVEENITLFLTEKTDSGEDLGEPTLSDPETGVAIYGEVPDGATLNVEIPEINGEPLPNVYDIKIYLADGVNEWQPIDEGKTVFISIPVEGDIANVTHFIDYAPALAGRDDLEYLCLDGADDAVLELLAPAVAASDWDGYVATEVFWNVAVSNGMVTVEAASFSLWSPDGALIEQAAVFLNLGGLLDSDDEGCSVNGYVAEHNIASEDGNFYDNGVYYVDPSTGGLEDGVLTIQAAWDEAATGGAYIGGTCVSLPWSSLTTNATISVTKIATDGTIETIATDVTMNTGTTGELLYNSSHADGGNRKRIALYKLTIGEDPPTGDRYIVTITQTIEERTITVRAEFIIANLTDSYTAMFEDPYGYLESFPDDYDQEEGIIYTFNGDATFPTPTVNAGYEFTGWVVSECNGDWVPGTVYAAGEDLSGHVGNVTFIAQAEPAGYGYKVVFTTIYPGEVTGLPSFVGELDGDGVLWQTTDTFTFSWKDQADPQRSGYTLVGYILDPGGLQLPYLDNGDANEYYKTVTIQGVEGAVTTVTIYPTWKGPNDALYTVNHYVAIDPNKANDALSTDPISPEDFALWQTVQRYGEIGTVAQVQGFEIPGYEIGAIPEVYIAEDGSSVVNVFYYLKSYNAVWSWYDDDGVLQSEPVSYKYGAKIVQYDAPTRKNYSLAYWQGYEEDITMPIDGITFFAIWKAKTYALYYMTGLGTYIEPTEGDYGSTVSVTEDIPERTGYTFGGWFTEQDGQGDEVHANETITLDGETGDKYLYAYWIPEKHIITFLNEDGTQLKSGECDYGTTPSYDGATPTKAADTQYTYTFTGWTSAGGIFYDKDAELPTVTGDMTYTATYSTTVNSYTVTWIVDGVETEETYEYGATPSFKGSTDKAADAQYTYTFTGWSPAISTVTGNATYTAQYSSTVNKYTVTWKNEDGSVLETDENVAYGATPTYDGATPAKAATAQYTYTFTGWSPAISAVTGDVTYTATYNATVNQYTLTGIIEHGTVTGPDTVDYNTQAQIHFTADAGYRMVRWFASNGASGEFDTDHQSSWSKGWTNLQQDITVTVVTEAIVYTITFDANGGAPVAAQEYTIDQVITLPTPTREGYTFNGWKVTSVQGAWVNATVYDAGAELTSMYGDVILEAQWTVNQYTITFKDGDTVLSTITKDYGTNVEAPADPTKEGYTFTGWNSAVPDTMPAENMIISATWAINQYTVSFNTVIAVTNSDALTDQTLTYGQTVTIPEPTPENTSFLFEYWEAGGQKYYSGNEVQVTADMTFVAVWTPPPFEITYQFVGLPASMKPALGNDGGASGTQVTLMQIAGLTINGYHLDSIKAVGATSGNEYTVTDYVITMPAEDVVVTLTYSLISYTITFDSDGGNAVSDLLYDIHASIQLPKPQKLGYTFDGWKVIAADGNWLLGSVYDAGEDISDMYGDVTLQAQWKVVIYIGVNLEYHQPNGDYYHTFRDEPGIHRDVAVWRVYYDNSAWNVNTNWYNAVGYAGTTIDIEELITAGYIQGIKDAEGVFDPTGESIRQYFRFSANQTDDDTVYQDILGACIAANPSGTDIAWNLLTAADCTIVPYVLKLQDDGIWYVDMVVKVNPVSLTISVEGNDVDSNDAFLYQISAPGLQTITVVARKGNPVTINGLYAAKQYTVTELTDWSWKYGPTVEWSFSAGGAQTTGTSSAVDIVLVPTRKGTNMLSFTNTPDDPGWIGKEVYTKVKFD